MTNLLENIKEEQLRWTKTINSSIEKTAEKSADGKTVYKMIISTNQIDRYDEIVRQEGIDTSEYNGCVLWSHDYRIPAIGKTIDLVRQKSKTIAKFIFAETEFAKEIEYLVENGFITDSSIGFISTNFDRDKLTHIESKLLEWSICNIGANPGAHLAKGIVQGNCVELKDYICKKGDIGCKLFSKVMTEIKKLEAENITETPENEEITSKTPEKPETNEPQEDLSEKKEEPNKPITSEETDEPTEAKEETEEIEETEKLFYEAKDIDLEFLKEFENTENIEAKIKGETEITEGEKEFIDKFCEMGLLLKKKNGIIAEMDQEQDPEKPLNEKINQDFEKKLDQILQEIKTNNKEDAEELNLIKLASKTINIVLSKRNNKI